MGRSLVTIDAWGECRRCPRHEHRLGVFAPAWQNDVEVVVLGLAAGKASQATQMAHLELLGVAEALRDRLRLSPCQCPVDYLLACGFGGLITADQVAACSARFAQRQAAGAVPKVIVFVGEEALALATEAGLVGPGGVWSAAGSVRASVVCVASVEDRDRVVDQVAQLLGRRPVLRARGAPVHVTAAQADKLLGVLGEHKGHGWLKRGDRDWHRSRRRPLKPTDVLKHLRARAVVSPLHPEGPWPFVVVDVDRHNAVQEAEFAATLKALRRVFARSFWVTSSFSGGVHVYVRLPDGMTYAEGALTVRAYVTMLGLRWRDVGARHALRAELLEVPSQPPRLPFGPGSERIDARTGKPSSASLDDQLGQFVRFAQNGDASDLHKVKKFVEHALALKKSGSLLGLRRRIERRLADEEVKGLRSVELEPGDPWKKVLPELSRPLQIVATAGTATKAALAAAATRDLKPWPTLVQARAVPRPRVEVFTDLKSLRKAAEARCRSQFAAFMGEEWSALWEALFAHGEEAVRVERKAARFLSLGRRRDDVLDTIRAEAKQLPGEQAMFATRVLLQRDKEDMPRWREREVSASPRAHLVQRFRLGYPNKFHHVYGAKIKSATVRTIAEVSILCGNRPHVPPEQLNGGMKATDYIRLEESAVRAAIRRAAVASASPPKPDTTADSGGGR